ncbi:chromosomal replication initiator protein DnaA [Chloroflexota bacterium]
MEARSAKEIWEAALGELQIQVNKPNYRTWLEKTVGLDYQDNQFVVGVPNPFVAEYLDKNQRSLIEKTLIGLTKHNTNVLFRVDTSHKNSLGSYGVGEEVSPTVSISFPRFNARYTFDSFIVGNGNRLAYAAALGIAENRGYAYNPLFIYGGVGLGKTHLLHAIGHMALAAHRQVIYASAEQFTNEYINAIQGRKTEEFRNKYRNIDLLLIDDINFLSGKEQTEESFFHTFNELHNANHQIAITCDRPPKSLPLLQDRLRSRFEWGLVADIQLPDFETRLAILQAKASTERPNVTLDVLELIAQRMHQSIRELEGSLNRVLAYAKLIRALPTPELAAQALEYIANKKPKTASITPDLVIEAVANSFQLTPQDLKSPKRDRQTALARQVVVYLLKQETNYSLTQIGKELGDRDHHVISQAYKRIASDMTSNPDLNDKILAIQQELHPARY